MGLLQDWRDMAYSQQTDKRQLQKFWTDYFMIEKGIYEKLLANPDEEVKGTVKELADKYGISVILFFVGVKMLLSHFLPIPIVASLGVIVGILTLSVLASKIFPPKAA